MIKKTREMPLHLLKEEALLRRLPLNHKKREKIQRNIKKGQAGYKGELELDFQLSYLDEDNIHVFQNLRIPIGEKRFFQMDTLILTPHFALIIESKNIYGTLYFDPHSKQVIRTFDDTKEGFPDPIQQVKRQEKMFNRWMLKHMVKSCPTHSLVAIGYPSTIVKGAPNNQHIFQKVLRAEHIPDKMDELLLASQTPSLTPYQIKKITQLLLQQHTPSTFDVFTQYSISSDELMKGVPCPQCSAQTMQRIYGKWLCPHCHTISFDAHELVVQDYLLLCGPLSNSQLRHILQVDSTHTVKRLLQGMNIPSKGSKRGRVYLLPEP